MLVAAVTQTSSFVPWLIVLTPLFMAAALFCIKHTRALMTIATFSALPAIYFALSGGDYVSVTSWIFFGSELAVDKTSQLFLLLAGVLWCLAMLYAKFYMAKDPRQTSFFIFMLLSMCGCFGLTLSQDTFGFITFFTLMSLSSFALVIHQLSDQARNAAKSYIRWVIIGEVLLFTGFCLINWHSKLSENADFTWITSLVIIIGFGTKVGLFGLHWWLPKAHPVAPVPASAVLSGFMVKAGVIGWIRFVPHSVEPIEIIGYLLIALGLTGTFVCAVQGLFQRDPKAVLAYSTVSQMGIIAMAFGVSFLIPENRDGIFAAIIMYSIHHGLAKSALFFSVGIAPALTANNVTRYLAYMLMILPALALVGAPFFSGAYAKLALKEQIETIGLLPTLISLSSIFTGLLMVRFISIMHCNATSSIEHHYDRKKYTPLLLISLVTCLLVTAWPFFLFENLSISGVKIFSSSWPIAVAISLGLFLNKYIGNYVDKVFSLTNNETRFLSSGVTYFSSLITSLSKTKEIITMKRQSFNVKYFSVALNRLASVNSAHLSVVILMVLSLLFIALIIG